MALADKFLPSYQFSERHSVRVAAPGHAILRAIDNFSGEGDRFISLLIAVREAPARFAGAFGFSTSLKDQSRFGMSSFANLGVSDEQIVYGLIGRFWRPNFGLEKVTNSDCFLAFEQAGVAKLVMSFCLSVDDDTGQTLLTTETRVFCPDRRSLLLFSVYWWVIRAPSGLIRRRMLAAIKSKAENEMERNPPR